MLKKMSLLILFLLVEFSLVVSSQTVKENLSDIYKDQNTSSIDEIKIDTIQPPIIKDDFIVNSFEGNYGAEQKGVSIAADSSGNYALAWIDSRDGRKNIYAQFFNSSGEKLGDNIKINEEGALYGYEYTTIAANKNGDYVICWIKDYSNIMVRRFNKNGEEVGNILQVNSNYSSAPPLVIVNDDSSFIVSWSASDVLVKFFDKDGNPATEEIIINEPDNYYNTYSDIGRNIASDSLGNLCVVWGTTRDSYTNIYLQMIDNFGNKVGNNILVNSLNDTTYKHSYQIASTDNGNFLITWKSSLNYEPGQAIKSRIYNINGSFVTEEFTLRNDYQQIISDRDSTFILLWSEENSFGSRIFMQKIRTSGVYLSEKRPVNLDGNNSLFFNGFKATDIINNNLLFALEVRDRNDANIYSQRFNEEFETVGAFIKANDDAGGSYQQKSSVKFNNNGESIVVWEDQRNGRNDLYAQVYDKDFNPVGGNIQVNETDADQWLLQDVKVGYFSDGTFVIAFSNLENNPNTGINISNIYFQLINTSGEKIENNKAALKDLYGNHKLSMNINSEDEILVCFYNSYQSFTRKYNNDLSLLSLDTDLNIQEYNNFDILAVSIDSLFNILVTWRSFDYQSNGKIMGKFFDENGKSLSGSFLIENIGYPYNFQCLNDKLNYAVLYFANSNLYIKRRYNLDKEYIFNSDFSVNNIYQSNPNLVEFKNQKILFTLNDRPSSYNSPTEVLAYYLNDNKRERELYKIHSFTNLVYDYYYYNENYGRNSVDIFNNKLFFSYESNLNEGTGFDIWANVLQLDSIDFKEEQFLLPIVNDILYNNYPNPFNNRTKIIYEIAAYHKVKLAVYDILGREVKVLVNQDQEKGFYEVDFDASGLASGIYFYKLDAFNTIVKKMILVK